MEGAKAKANRTYSKESLPDLNTKIKPQGAGLYISKWRKLLGILKRLALF